MLPAKTDETHVDAPGTEDELGYLDYLEIFEEAVSTITQFGEDASGIMNSSNSRIKTRTAEIVTLNEQRANSG